MTDLQTVAKQYEADGWTITSITDLQFTASKKSPVSMAKIVVGIIGLFFAVVPGLIVLISAFNQKEASVMVTAEEATEILRKAGEANLIDPMGLVASPQLRGNESVAKAKSTNKGIVLFIAIIAAIVLFLVCQTVVGLLAMMGIGLFGN